MTAGIRPRLQGIHTARDFRAVARRRLPRTVFDFIDGGAEEEVTLRGNGAAIDRIRFRPKVLTDVAQRDTGSHLFEAKLSAPFAVAPMGGLGVAAANAEVAIAKACASASIPYTLSMAAGVSIDDLRSAAPAANLWFQLYALDDEGLNRALLARAQAAGYQALVITVDTQVIPKRLRDLRNGFALPPPLSLRAVVDALAHPGWLAKVYFGAGLPGLPVLAAERPELDDLETAIRFLGQHRRQGLRPSDLLALRGMWRGPLLLKGVSRSDDAMLALECGVDGVILSNHGGRNLDCAAPPMDLLPEVMDAVTDRLSIMIDGSFWRGGDIIKALARGARAVLLGRPFAYAVSAAGQAGVSHLISTLTDEISRTMGFLGCTGLHQLDSSLLQMEVQP
jgi:isopentenyl diphosphate isomerase/L-lactate dehydrogenase-like FMN-dependent dehydrogenase